MGHLAGKDVFRKVGEKVDRLAVRVPWTETFHRIVKELYSEAEADVYVRMPYGLANLGRLSRVTGIDREKLRPLLEGMADKGLVMDLWMRGAYHYMPSPLIVGLFEFSMMRTGGDVDSRLMGRLFHEYLSTGEFYAANDDHGRAVGPIRALPHEDAVADSVEILDYERAGAIADAADRFSVGICSCRHEKEHAGKRGCNLPLETCTSMGTGADYLIRHGMAREISKGEMLDRLARSRELGLVLSADNVQRRVSFICHCCACCCNVLQGISRFGCPHTIVTSNFIARSAEDACNGCGKCAKACPIDAIEMVPMAPPSGGNGAGNRKKKSPQVDQEFCMGCGVCALACSTGAMKLDERGRRVIHPETTFERVILQCLEAGTLQYQIFDNPSSLGQDALRAIVGAFLGLPPVKRALMSDALRSRFLHAMKGAVRRQGKGGVLEI